MNKNDIVKIKIEDISTEGRGIGRADGMAVFVKDAVTGDVVEAEITKVKKNYAFGNIRKYLKKSEDRTEVLCPYNDRCGGCIYQELNYEAQLSLKKKQVSDKLIRLGGIKAPVVRDVIGMEYPFNYRNKAVMPVSTGGLITKKGGIVQPVHEPRVGFYRAKSHEVIDCGDCLLQSEPAMAAAEALRRFMEEDNITSYDERWDKGLMKSMTVRTAFGSGQVMVILTINGKGIPNAEKLVSMLDEAIYEAGLRDNEEREEYGFTLESVILNIQKKGGSVTGEWITLAGIPVITEFVGGLEFEISPQSFYQVNPVQMEALYGKAIEYAELNGNETVLDLYCGVGSIGLFFADYMRRLGGKGRVIGIESIKEAVTDANRNAVINGIVNARYICGKAEEELPKLMKGDYAEKGIVVDNADIVILDPPRAGCDERLIEAAAELSPEKIIYISCDPATLSRDIKRLSEKGYEFCEAAPVDMFPWTGAIEVAALITKMK